MNNLSPQPLDERHVTFEGKKLLYFGGCDYLRLSHQAEIRHTAIESLRNEPSLSSSASRKTTGDHSIYRELENQLAVVNHMEDSILTGAGYLANLCLNTYLRDNADGLLMDEQCHPSLKDAAKLSGLPVLTYQHCDVNSAVELSNRLPTNQHWVLLSESMFGLDGSVMPLQAFLKRLPAEISFLLDDAHGFGVLGENYLGKGTRSVEDSRTIIKTLSLAKATGCHGGAIVASLKVTTLIRNQENAWAGHTPIPMHLAHAAIKSIKCLSTKPELRLCLNQNITMMSEILSSLSMIDKHPLNSPVFSLAHSLDEIQWKDMNHLILNAGIYPSFIQYPGSKNQLIFRLAISSSHQKEDLQQLGTALKQLRQKYAWKRFLFADQ